MKRFSLFISMLTLVLSASAVNIDNLFSGDSYNFEGGTKGNWYGWGEVFQAPTIVSPGYNSEYCMKLVPTETVTDAWKAQAACEFAALDQTQTYHLKFMAKGKGTIQIFYQNADYSKQMYQSVFTLTDEWQEFTETMNPTSNDFIKVLFNFGTATECYIDNVEFGLEDKGIPAGDYYLYNVEADKFLGGGNDWGTHASLVENGYKFGILPVDGGYTIDSYTYNSDVQHYLADNAYIDANAFTWTMKKAGKFVNPLTGIEYPTYNISNAGKFVGNQDGNYVTTELTDGKAEAAQWILFTREDIVKNFEFASFGAQVDATCFIEVQNFSRNHKIAGKASPWIVENCTNSNLSGGNNLNNCAESWHSTFDIYQDIKDIPNGYYTLSIQGFWRPETGYESPAPYFYANDVKQELGKITGTENSMSDASVSFSAGKYYQTPITVHVTDGTLRVGIKNESNPSIWVIFDNFELSYCGLQPLVAPDNVEVGSNGEVVPVEVVIGADAIVTAKFDAAAAAEALGVASLKDAEMYAIDASAAFSLNDVVYRGETNYRNANGDVCDLASAAIKVNVANDGNIQITPMNLPAATAPIMNVYNVFMANNAGYLLTTQVSFVDPKGDGATAIESVKTSVEGGIIYDLTGRKVSSVKAGQIYIVNGKKVILK